MPTFANRKTNIALGYCDQPGIHLQGDAGLFFIFPAKIKEKFCVIKNNP